MKRKIYTKGETINCFVFINELEPLVENRYKQRIVSVMCPLCKKEKSLKLKEITSKRRTSCGCGKFKHGLSRHPLYKVWEGIIQRTSNPKSARYNDYGGRGITICNEWKNNFKSFYDYIIVLGWEKGLQIGRKDNNKGYEKGNIRIVNNSINNLNTRHLKSNNKSGVRGVCYDKSRDKWIATVNFEGKVLYSKRFSSMETAIIERNNFIEINKLPNQKSKIIGV